MAEMPFDSTITPDAKSLRGLAHPLRIRLLGLLRSEGPSTATRLAERVGLSSGATSYHLRQLAAYGFITEDEDSGTSRERWWRAAHRITHIRPSDDPETAEATDGFLRGATAFWAEQMNRAIDERPTLPPAWRAASTFSDYLLRLTATELRQLRGELADVIARYRQEDPSVSAIAPDNSMSVVIQLQAFPLPGTRPDDGAEP